MIDVPTHEYNELAGRVRELEEIINLLCDDAGVWCDIPDDVRARIFALDLPHEDFVSPPYKSNL